ncbi:biotin--[acetyl-CoA-carboxylase] ligase [Flavisolibacter nicotianae]|uniref:biotin--[acetyl-CoA-carboxylase] ligase n=1 Tax=Flavisolibacter nicotianae TaxID=2364882 RepID=UPI000EABB854|nr:biotin--[acetyl-CoA-carboxylase] ligase [Flavisolibacter nicotianae]
MKTSFIYSIGTPFEELQQVESTNNYATGLVHAGLAQSGMAVFAHDQTKGKGQRNKEWQSEGGKNISLSIILQPVNLALSQSFLLSMATAVGVYNFFAAHAGPETKVKWPNDLFWRDRKAGGILIENIVKGSKWEAAIVGIGINVNQTHFDHLGTKAVSLKQITGRDQEPLALAKELCSHLEKAYDLLEKLPSEIKEQYRKHLYKLNETVRLKQGSRVFDAAIRDVSSLGELVVEHATEERFGVGEVEWV